MAEGARPLVARPTGAVSGTPFGLVLGQQPIGCQGGHALCPAPWPQHVLPQGIPAVTVPCHHSKDRPAPRSRGRDQLRQAAFSPKANTRVAKRLGFHEVKANLEGDSGPPRDGCEPSWARPCEASGTLLLSNGGTGGGHAACTLWPPPAPFGYFPARGKYLVRPQADETSLKQQALTPTKAPSSPNFNTQKPCPRIREHGLANKLMETATLTHRKSDKTAPCHPRSPHHAAHHKAPVPGCGFSP